VAFNAAGNTIALSGDMSGRVVAYEWSGSGFGAKYADPATIPTTDTAYGVAFTQI
jgi:hypothetical protein